MSCKEIREESSKICGSKCHCGDIKVSTHARLQRSYMLFVSHYVGNKRSADGRHSIMAPVMTLLYEVLIARGGSRRSAKMQAIDACFQLQPE